MRRALAAPWTLAVAALAVLATAAAAHWPATGALLIADADAITAGQWWRVLTGPLVHAGPEHLLVDLAVLVAVGLLYERALGRLWPLLLLCGTMAPSAAAFAVDGELAIYYGSSGLTHALLAAAVLHELARSRSALAFAAAAVLIGKVGWEAATGAPLLPLDMPGGVRQIPIAHLVGALVGAAFALDIFASRPPRPSPALPREPDHSSGSAA